MLGLLLLGLVILSVFFPRWNYEQQRLMIARWSRWLLGSIGVIPRQRDATKSFESSAGLAEIQGAVLLAANHVSWLDIFVINAFKPAHFVAKSDIRGWPLAGSLCAKSGTIFIERSRRHAVREVLQTMRDHLGSGQLVAVFPEGTTGDLYTLKPFHANFLQAAIDTQVAVLPIALTYKSTDGSTAEAVQFIGETSFVESAWRVAGEACIYADILLTTPIDSQGLTRHQLCAQSELQISLALGVKHNLPA